MSSSRMTDPDALRTAVDEHLQVSLADPLSRVAFWAAIVLPFLYLPLLVTGLDRQSTTVAFVALLTLNAVAIALGQRYDG